MLPDGMGKGEGKSEQSIHPVMANTDEGKAIIQGWKKYLYHTNNYSV